MLERLEDAVLVLPAAPVQYASRDTEHPYVPDRELFWLTDLTEPDTVAVLRGGEEPRLAVFARGRDAEAELWTGERLGVEAAGERAAADEAHAIETLEARMADLLDGTERVFYRLGSDERVDRLVRAALGRARRRGSWKGTGPRAVVDPGELLDDLRLRKDPSELFALRRACEVTAGGHRAGGAAVGSGVGEGEVEAAIEAAFRAGGATRPGFETIVGSGPNACVLHYARNEHRIPEGGLVLIDAGAEVDFYHGDVTRTVPASGRFSDVQRDVYVAVRAALQDAIGTVRPGSTIRAVHEAAVHTLVRALVDMGVLAGDVDDLVEEGAHRPFFPHRTSHWLGLDVHDPGDYARDGRSRTLEPGMVFTVEPGLYFGPGARDEAPPAFAGIGVRIEEDVVVTEEGCEVLTSSLPTEPSEVEAMAGG